MSSCFSQTRCAHISGQSDFDLLGIVPDSDLPRRPREARSYDLLRGFITRGPTTPVDLIVLTRDEFYRSSGVKTSLASTARTQGRLIYG